MRGAMRSLILLLLTAGSSIAAFLADRILPGGNRAERVMGWWGRAFVRLGGGSSGSRGWRTSRPAGPSWWRTIRAPWTSRCSCPRSRGPSGFSPSGNWGRSLCSGRRWRRRGTSSSTGTTRGTRSGCSGRPGGSFATGGSWSSFRKGPVAGTGRSGVPSGGLLPRAEVRGARRPGLRRRRVPGDPKGGYRVRPAELLVRALPPLSPGEGAGGSKERIAAAVRARILAARANERVEREGEE